MDTLLIQQYSSSYSNADDTRRTIRPEEVFVDGGWGVDALLGKHTRSHGDVDIALQHKDVPKLRTLLEARGYKDVPRHNTRDCNFVMGDDKGHEVDFHSYTFDAHGTIAFGIEYPLDSFDPLLEKAYLILSLDKVHIVPPIRL